MSYPAKVNTSVIKTDPKRCMSALYEHSGVVMYTCVCKGIICESILYTACVICDTIPARSDVTCNGCVATHDGHYQVAYH